MQQKKDWYRIYIKKKMYANRAKSTNKTKQKKKKSNRFFVCVSMCLWVEKRYFIKWRRGWLKSGERALRCENKKKSMDDESLVERKKESLYLVGLLQELVVVRLAEEVLDLILGRELDLAEPA